MSKGKDNIYTYYVEQYLCATTDEDMANVYYCYRFFQNYDKGFSGAMTRISVSFEDWVKKHKAGNSENVKKVLEIWESAGDLTYGPSVSSCFIKGYDPVPEYKEAYKIIRTAIPYLLEAEKEVYQRDLEKKKKKKE